MRAQVHTPRIRGQPNAAPSIAAMVANLDDEFAQWPASVRLNKHPDETVDNTKGLGPIPNEQVMEAGDMLLERLRAWCSYKSPKNDRPPPDRIMIYRDGVSESQFDMVKRDEFNGGMYKTIKEFYAQKKAKLPHIMLICAIKRHNTRLYPAEKDSAKQFPKYFQVAGRGDRPSTRRRRQFS